MTPRHPHSNSFETDTWAQAPADEFFSEDRPTPPEGTDVVDPESDPPLGSDQPAPPWKENARPESAEGTSTGEDTAMLPVVDLDQGPPGEGALADPPMATDRLEPISPDPPDTSAFPSESAQEAVSGIEASAPTGQIDALTPELIAAFAASEDPLADEHQLTDQREVIPDADEPTAVTTVIDAVLAEDDLAPLDPHDGVEAPPAAEPPADGDQSEPPVALESPPVSGDDSPPAATAEFSLADIAAQAEPTDSGDAPQHSPTPTAESAHPDETVAQPESDTPETSQVEAIEVETIEPETIQVGAIQSEAVAPEAVEPEVESSAQPKRRGLFGGRRDRRRDVPSDDQAAAPLPPTAEADAQADDEPVFISPKESLFGGAEPPPDVEQPDDDQTESPSAPDPPALPTESASPPATAKFSLADIAAQAEPTDPGDAPQHSPTPTAESAHPDETVAQPESDEPGTARFEAVDEVEVEAVGVEAEPDQAGQAGSSATPKRRGLFGRRRRAAPSDDQAAAPLPPTAEADAQADDEPVFISPKESLFGGAEPPDAAVDTSEEDARRPRRNVTLPTDTAAPVSWVDPEPSEPVDEATDVAGIQSADLGADDALFADEFSPIGPTSAEESESIGWMRDAEPVEASEPRSILFDEGPEPEAASEVVPDTPDDPEPETQATDQIIADQATPDDPEPETQATDQIIADPADDDWTQEWAEAGWGELDHADLGFDTTGADSGGAGSEADLVLFPDSFPPLPADDSEGTAGPGLASQLDDDWSLLPSGNAPTVASPDNLSLFDEDDQKRSVASHIAPQPSLTTDSEFFSLQKMLDGLPEPDESARLRSALGPTETAPTRQAGPVPGSAESKVDAVTTAHGFVDLAEIPEEPGRVLEGAFALPAAGSQASTGASDPWAQADRWSAPSSPPADVFGELADLDDSVIGDPFDDKAPDDDRGGKRVEGHDWWDFDDVTQRNDDRGGFRAAANATEAFDLSGTEQLHMEASDLAAPPTLTKPSDLESLDGPDSEAYEAALYAFFDAPGRDDDSGGDDTIDPEYDDGPPSRGKGRSKRNRSGKRAKARSAKAEPSNDGETVEADLFARADAELDDDRDDVDRWVEGTTDTHADWLERTKRSTFSNLLGVLIALAAAVGVVLATVWVVSNI